MAAIKILQCVYSMNRGGVETWLMHVLRRIDRTRYQIDFMTFSGKPGDFDDEIKYLGSQIFPCSPASRPWRHARELKSLLERHGPYDVVHSHDPTWNGSVLAIAKKSGVRVRIAHSHNDIRQSIPSGFAKRAYTKWSIWKSKRCATHGLACSRLAASSYFGESWQDDSRWNVFYCGEDFGPFRQEIDIRALRKSFNLPGDAFIIGHVGNYKNNQKNHSFIIKIAQETAKRDPQIRFMLIGDGVMRNYIENEVTKLGLTQQFVFMGTRPDVPRLMLGAMDMFLFPSLYEGLGLTMVEAQAAGLPCLCSDTLPAEVNVLPGLVKRIPLTKHPADWAKVIFEIRNEKKRVSPKEALKKIERSKFNICNTIKDIENLYSGIVLVNTQ